LRIIKQKNKNKLSIRNSIKLTFTIAFLIFLTISFNSLGIDSFKDYLSESNKYLALAIFFLRFSSALLPILPGSAYGILAGSLLGFKKGFVVIFFSDLLSCLICFSLSKLYGRYFVKKIVSEKFLKKIESLNSHFKSQNFIIITLLLMTGFHDFFSYGMGLTNLNFKIYFASLVMSTLITAPILVFIGMGIISENKLFFVFVIIMILLSLMLKNYILKAFKFLSK
tara:strand:+ start:178 stop:852 length:675 start_codon:yes stop_codon:yes gene_type:complete